jgi:hypothetical protein
VFPHLPDPKLGILGAECLDLMASKMELMERRVDTSKGSIRACFACDFKGRATLVGPELGEFCPFQC